MRFILIATIIAFPHLLDAGDRIGLRIDHVEVTKTFLTELDANPTVGAGTLNLDKYQYAFLTQAFHDSRQGNVFSRPKTLYKPGQVIRFDIPPNSNKQPKAEVWDAEHGSKFTLTPTMTRPGAVGIVLRPDGNDAQTLSVAVQPGQITAFILAASDRQLQ